MIQILPDRRRWIVWALRLTFLAAVIVGVRGTFQGAVDRLAEHQWTLRPAWLVASGALYILGLGSMAWFWRQALSALDQPVPWWPLVRAYFLGHLGKYVPGKALVIILRVGGIRPWIRSIWLAVVSTLVESLLMMAVGAAIAAVLFPAILPPKPKFLLIAAAAATICVLPTLPPFAHGIARFGLRRLRRSIANPATASATEADIQLAVERFTWPLWAKGCLAAGVCWCFLGLSLWATLRGIGVDQLRLIADGPFMLGAVSLAVVGGFVSFLPGGLVVRDALLLEALAPVCGEADALVAALLLRLVWLVSELVACGILYGVTFRRSSA
jgi:uncharacterized membrane protein YbhN (UPF0104 family)